MKSSLFAFVFIFLISCGGQKSMPQSQAGTTSESDMNQNQSLENTEWIFQNYKRIPSNIQETNVTLNFGKITNHDIEYSGKSFVNNYGGRFRMNGNHLEHIGNSFMTEIASLDESQNALESSYLKNLSNIIEFKVIENELQLFIGVNGKPTEMMVFKRK